MDWVMTNQRLSIHQGMGTLPPMKTLVPFLSCLVLLSGCSFTSHEVQRSSLGVSRASSDLLDVLDQPGPVELETVASCDWAGPRSGLVNLEHPTAREAGLVEGEESIQVFFHVLRHPTKGTFIVDTGIETALRDAPDKSALGALVKSAMNLEKMKPHMPLGEWLAQESKPLAGVFLTHLHIDHITGMPDVPAGTPVYTGPGEASARAFLNLFSRGTADRALEGKPALSEWTFAKESVRSVRGRGGRLRRWLGVGALGAGPHAGEHRLPGEDGEGPGAARRRREPHPLGLGARRRAGDLHRRRSPERGELQAAEDLRHRAPECGGAARTSALKLRDAGACRDSTRGRRGPRQGS